MLNPTIQDALNQQINLEFSSSYAYLAMAAYFESTNLTGFASWMRVQSQEENTHAMKLFNHMHDRGGRATLKSIPQPQLDFTSPLEAFESALQHEQQVTEAINNVYDLASKANDHATRVMLQWFINEQVEEEKNAGQIVDRLKMAGDSAAALLILDQQLGSRSPAVSEAGPAGGAE